MTVNNYEPQCPKCKAVMLLRTNRKTGNQFYGCAKFPECREVLSIRQVERAAYKLAASTEVRLRFAEQMRNSMAKPKYYEYLRSDAWKRKKFELEQSARYRCQLCNKSKTETTLNVHHRCYDRLGHELPSDLIVLCRECHAKHHNKLASIPVTADNKTDDGSLYGVIMDAKKRVMMQAQQSMKVMDQLVREIDELQRPVQ